MGAAMDRDDIVEVWLTNGKRYRGRIVDPRPFAAWADDEESLVLCEGERYFVWIHRTHISRVRAVNARLERFVTRDADQVA